MKDASSGTLLDELNHKRRRLHAVPLVFVIPILSCLFLLYCLYNVPSDEAMMRIAAPLFTGSLFAFLPLLFLAFLWDHRRFSVVLYNLDVPVTAAFQALHSAFDTLAASFVVWHVRARAAVFDPKYAAGASSLLDVRPTYVGKQQPPLMRTNVETVSIFAGDGSQLCFFPDRLLVFGPDGVGAVNYRDLNLQCAETRFILDGPAPRDARVVDQTWKYVNKKSGPDLRFSDNPQFPIIHCERLHFTSTSGLNEILQFSRPGVGIAFAQAVQQLTAVLAAPSLLPGSVHDLLSTQPAQQMRFVIDFLALSVVNDDYFDAPDAAVCC